MSRLGHVAAVLTHVLMPFVITGRGFGGLCLLDKRMKQQEAKRIAQETPEQAEKEWDKLLHQQLVVRQKHRRVTEQREQEKKNIKQQPK